MASGTRDRLMHAAYQLFSRDGFHGVGLDRILDDTRERWGERGHDPATLELAREEAIIEVGSARHV